MTPALDLDQTHKREIQGLQQKCLSSLEDGGHWTWDELCLQHMGSPLLSGEIQETGGPLSITKQPEWAGQSRLWDPRTRWALGWSLL